MATAWRGGCGGSRGGEAIVARSYRSIFFLMVATLMSIGSDTKLKNEN
jgi:hypothetical protein